MTTIGDILLIFMVVTVSGLALWGTMVATSLLFPYKSARLAVTVEKRPWASLITGFFVTIPAILVLLFLLNVPNPAVKIFGALMFLLFLTIAAVGGSGQVRLLADRIKSTSVDMPMYGALTRASAILILVFNIPFVGWFMMAPLSIMAGVGSLVVNRFGQSQAPLSEGTQG